jgi:LPXTG-site transpeptidase (sortase) family protein
MQSRGHRARGLTDFMSGQSQLDPRERPHQRALGVALLVGGALLVVLTALVATGVVPLWQPSVPPPPVLVEARATRVTLAPDSSVADPASTPDTATANTPGAPTLLDPNGPTPAPAPRPSPIAVFGAPPDWTPVAQPPPAPPNASAHAEYLPDALATVLALAGPLPTFELPPPPTLITSALATPTPRPTAVPPPPPPGLPIHLVIPRIRVDTNVVELSTTLDARGVPQWETVPFVAGHYRVTGLAGAHTNVVFSGHVVTRDMGNVFRDLHLLRPGDPVVVYTNQGQFTYRVSELRLVDPADTSVLAPSTLPRLSLITCAGAFDFRTHTFTQRLIVVGDLVTA